MKTPPENTRRIFIVLDDFTEQKDKLRTYLLSLIETAEEGQFLRFSTAYYREKTDVALIELVFGNSDFSPKKRRWLSKLAGEHGIPLLDPLRLSPEDRKSFYEEYLTKYPQKLDDDESLLNVFNNLEALVGDFDVDLDSYPTTAKLTKADTSKNDKDAEANKKILVQYQIGDEWHSAHLRSLTTKEAVLAVGSLPPDNKAVRIEFRLKELRALARGTIQNFPKSKTPSFKVNFTELTAQEEQGIMDLLLAATEEKIQLQAPPARHFPRFQLRWPVRFMIDEKVHTGLIQDISEQGLFVATQEKIAEKSFQLHFSHDQISTLITGIADVAREISDQRDSSIKSLLGYGLIMRNHNLEHNFQKFVGRVERRSRHHIAVAAERKKGATLVQDLMACGYEVSLCENTESILALQNNGNLPDVALTDDSFETANGVDDIRKLLTNISVTSIESKEKSADNRRLVDAFLRIR